MPPRIIQSFLLLTQTSITTKIRAFLTPKIAFNGTMKEIRHFRSCSGKFGIEFEICVKILARNVVKYG